MSIFINGAQQGSIGNITFPATQIASSNVNILDDYEEGIFCPTILDDSLNTGECQSYSTQVGGYTKIGNQIFYKLRLVVNSLGNLATCQQARIGGLPFTSSSTVNSDSSVVFGAATSLAINATESLAANICPNVTNIRLNLWDATGGVTDMTLAEVSAGAGFKISGVYNV